MVKLRESTGLVLTLATGFTLTGAVAQTPASVRSPPVTLADQMSGDLTPAHDPSIIKQGDTYYVFTTSQERDKAGMIHVRSSKDLKVWKREPSVFTAIPAWAKKAIPGTVGIWAPDASFVNGRYRVYYSISTFGSNRSAMGLATSASLNPKDPNYGWRDEGEVYSSNRRDDHNAIDPNFIVDAQGRHWLSFGSFWTGLKMFQLDPASGKRLAGSKLIPIAQRPSPGAVEAPFIIRRGEYYYLFASYDFCCRGADSTYYTIVGRSKDVTGPYLNAEGKPLMQGFGQIVLHAQVDKTKRWRGPGHVSILQDGNRDYIAYHSYDARNKGVPTLRVSEMGWSADGWPVAKL